MNQQRFDLCEQLCAHIDSLQENNADAASIRGVMASSMGRQKLAVRYFQRAIEVAPRRCEFHANLAGMFLLQGDPDKALAAYQRSLTLKPHQLEIQLGCATALLELGRFDEARAMMLAAHRRQPSSCHVLMRLFRGDYETGRLDEAEAWLQQVLKLDAGHAEAHYCYGMLLSGNGQHQAEAEAEVKEALRLNPVHAGAALLLSELKSYTVRDADVELLASMHADTRLPVTDKVKLGFAYGKVLDDLGEYDQAFDCFEQANQLRSEQSTYDNDQELGHLQLLKDTYTPQVLAHASDRECDAPLFIVGMPRSGSTLVEQILAAHPDVVARGECGFFDDALAVSSSQEEPLTVESLAAYDEQQWGRVADDYLQKLQQADTALRYTDKTLTNIRLIGAIHCALPKARIIHVQRHPLDNCLSIFRHNLLGAQFDYGRKLGELGYYYRMYQQLMQHWRDVLPAGVLYEVDYQSLVADPEPQTRQLLDACGLEWNESCLRFYEADNVVRTASFMQVRKPVSSGSVGVWKHYEKQLQPLIRILGVDAGQSH